MAKKKKLTKAERKEARLRKGKQWLLTYTGSPKKMNKHYRERFHVDAVTAAKDLQELGVNYTQEQLDQIKQAEEQRLRQRRMEREAKERERLAELYEDCDDRFAFIAGYTAEQIASAMSTDINLVALKVAHLATLGYNLHALEHKSNFLK